jgi:DNA-binding NtrC family response regulator
MARILLVDDEDCILRTTAILLESEGHSTVSVLNGREAQSQLAASEFDLVVTDIRMGPVDGMELIRWVHERKPELPIIVVSAYGSPRTSQEAMAQGASHYIRKPFKIDEMTRTIRETLAKAGKT